MGFTTISINGEPYVSRAAFDALVEAVERADLECRKPQTVTGVRRGLHTLTCLEGYDDGMPCRPCALRAALASAKEAVEGSDAD